MSSPETESSPNGIESLEPRELQALLAGCVKRYVGLLEEGTRIPPFPSDQRVNATEVVATVSAMLKQVDIEVFELAMWQSWGEV